MAPFFEDFLIEYGDSPIKSFIFFAKYFGSFVMYPVLIIYLLDGWLLYVQNRVKYFHRKHVLISINVPKEDEQSMKAVEQIFTHIYGTKKTATFTDRWWHGWTQDLFSFEIASDGGYIQYYVRCQEDHHDVVEAAIYAQYPDAEIHTVSEEDDYHHKLEVKMIEDGSYDLYGTELILDMPDIYCIRHWRGWEHSLPGKFIDPMAAILEIMSRMQPHEHVWFQILSQPTELAPLNKECQQAIDEFTGDAKKGTDYTLLDKIIHFPLVVLEMIHDILFSGELGKKDWSSKAEETAKRIFLVEWEREAVTELDMKRSRWPYKSKIRFIYWAKKDIFSPEKGRRGMMGAIRQFKFLNNFSEGRWTQVDLDDTWWFDNYFQPFQKLRLFWRKKKLIQNMKAMDMLRGEHEGFRLSVEELASLYHFPQIDVRAPFVQKAESRRVEPPTQLNFEPHTSEQLPSVEVRKENMQGLEAGIPSPVAHPEQPVQVNEVPSTGGIKVSLTPEQIAYQEKIRAEQEKWKNNNQIDSNVGQVLSEENQENFVQPSEPTSTQPEISVEPEDDSFNSPPPNLPMG